MYLRIMASGLILVTSLVAQTVQPVITEYRGKAEGKFAVTNNTESPMVVVLEPKSFSITAEGKGIFRDLDSGINVELSTMSVRLQPKQTYYIFYKANADRLPAWFTVYATFSSPQHTNGLDLRFMLPHTVYLYQKQPLTQDEVQVKQIDYNGEDHKLTCVIENISHDLARVQSVRATGDHALEDIAGFPMLPGATRNIEMDWKDNAPPTEIDFKFEHFDLKRHITNSPN